MNKYLIIGIVAILIIGGGWWYFNQSSVPATSETSQLSTEQTVQQNTKTNTQSVTNSQPTQTTPTQSNTSGMKTYNNSQYGFSFQYPTGLEIESNVSGQIHPFASLPTAHLEIWNNPVQTEGFISVSVSKDSSDISKCTVPGAFVWINNDPNIPEQYREKLAGNSKNVVMNGTTFLQYDVTSHDLVNGAERQYTTMRNGACVNIMLSAFPSACVNSGCEGRKWSAQTETALLNQLDTIAQTFRFN